MWYTVRGARGVLGGDPGPYLPGSGHPLVAPARAPRWQSRTITQIFGAEKPPDRLSG